MILKSLMKFFRKNHTNVLIPYAFLAMARFESLLENRDRKIWVSFKKVKRNVLISMYLADK